MIFNVQNNYRTEKKILNIRQEIIPDSYISRDFRTIAGFLYAFWLITITTITTLWTLSQLLWIKLIKSEFSIHQYIYDECFKISIKVIKVLKISIKQYIVTDEWEMLWNVE